MLSKENSNNKFFSSTQFSQKFSQIGDFNRERSACSIFSLLTAYHYLGDHVYNTWTSSEVYENILTESINMYTNLRENLPQYLSFEELLQLSGELSKIEPGITSSELVQAEVLGYNAFFPEDKDKYCTIFLKDSNFFLVLNDKIHQMYLIRDCHREYQYNFNNLDDLQRHLNKEYRMNCPTVVDGYPIPEFNNIEFITIDKPFNIFVIPV